MAAHILVDLNVTDREKFKAYANGVQATVKEYGGRYNCKWGYPQTLEGEWQAHRIVMIEFPTVEQARQWWDSEKYRPLKELRREGSSARIILVDVPD